MQAGVSIYNEIHALRSDGKNEMSEFRLSFRNDMKKELNKFREEINRKLEEATGELQATIARAGEAEQRISDIEDWNTAAKEALTQALHNQEVLQAKLTELEAHSRRNNLRTALPPGARPKASPRRTAEITGDLLPRVQSERTGIAYGVEKKRCSLQGEKDLF